MFLEEGKAYTGIIIWVGAACEMEEGTVLPMRYIIEADQSQIFPYITTGCATRWCASCADLRKKKKKHPPKGLAT
jgi:hypothetical protein